MSIRVAGVILAGGRASRMGGEKPLMEFRGRPLVAHAIERARPQVDELLVNAAEPERYRGFGCTVISDSIGGFQGPLAGVLAGLDWVHANRKEASWLATFACDAPFFPEDMVERLIAGTERTCAGIAVAASGTQHHPVFAVWSTAIAAGSKDLTDGQSRKMDDFIERYPNVRVMFPIGAVDPFFNINTPEDLARAEAAPRPGSEAVAQ
jgi:molybdopterin-guanine dinucleotide biosynthesis protein A